MTRTILLFLLCAYSAHASTATLTNRPGGPAWLSGWGQISSIPDGFTAWSSWLGREPDIVVVWSNPASTWKDFETGKANVGYNFTSAMKYLPKTTPIIHSYPMLPDEVSNRKCQNPTVWDQFAAGSFDSHYQAMAQNMKTLIQDAGRDPSNTIIRLGWEMNGDWYAWSICNKVSQFKQSWARAVGIIKSVMPGVMIDFSPGGPYAGFTAGRDYGGTAGVNLDGFLPPDSTYDVISLSHHDGLPFVTSESTWQEHYTPPASQREIGLKELVDTAAKHGKKFALTEWGTQMADCDGPWTTSPDPVLFIRKTYEFLSANRANLAWDTHFSVSCTQLYNRQSTEAAKTFRTLWTADSEDPPKPAPPELVTVE